MHFKNKIGEAPRNKQNVVLIKKKKTKIKI